MESGSSAKGSDGESTQLQIRFVTKQEQYSVPDIPFAVSSGITTTELNSLVQELSKDHGEPQKKVEFDFLAGGEFIRTSLGEHVSSRNISTEAIIDVEYLERLPAPQPKDCIMHDDWVSAVHAHRNWILTGCYDNTLHLWTLSGKHKLTIPGHTSSVKAVAWVSSQGGTATFVSGSHDQTALLWEWNIEKNVIECVHLCKGHALSIESIGVNTDSSLFATGSFDTMLKIWSTSTQEESSDYEENAELKIKRQRIGDSCKQSQIRTPRMTLQGHKESVSGISWTSSKNLVTCSMDHTMRMWDVEAATSISEIQGNKSFLDVHSSPFTGLLVTGSCDRHIRLYDPRSSEGAVVKSSFSSHSMWVSSVRWSPSSDHLFISASYDKQVKLWDTRSPQVPLYDLSGHEDKVLCSDWSLPSLMISGGADNTLRLFKTRTE